MSRESQRVAGGLLILLPTVVLGGVRNLSLTRTTATSCGGEETWLVRSR